jgi:hypothetical protein
MGKLRRIGNGDPSPSAAGTGIDVYGGPVVDPTKNVLDLVRAESKYQDAMRDAESRLASQARAAEQRRIDDLAALRLAYDQRIAEDLRVNVKTTSDQLAGQLVKETGSLSSQIGALTTSFTNQLTTLTTSFTNQISALTSALTPRIADLERFRWEQGGKAGERDPAVSNAIAEMTKAITKLEQDRGAIKAHTEGGAVVWGAIAVIATFLLSVGTLITLIVTHHW